MSFESAIPLNRFAYPQDRREQMAAPMATAKGEATSRAPRQSVNISEETLMRLARSKLARAMTRKLAYNHLGAISSNLPVGSQFSAKA